MNHSPPDNLGEAELWRRYVAPPAAKPCPDPLLLAQYLDGRCEAADRDAIESHLSACRTCLDTVIDARRLMSAAPLAVPPQVSARAVELAAGRKAGWWAPLVRWAATAAAAAVIALAGHSTGLSTFRERRTAEVRLAKELSFGLVSEWPDPLGTDVLIPRADRAAAGGAP